jgi:DNA-binding transcriptional LysR family regulator
VLGTMQAQGMRAIDLAGTLAAFRAEHPGVEVKIRHAGGSGEMAHAVVEARLDLAFVALPGGAPTGLNLLPLASESTMLAVPAAHPLAGRASVELASLRDQTLVDLPAGWGIRIAVDRSFAAAGVTRSSATPNSRRRDQWRTARRRRRVWVRGIGATATSRPDDPDVHLGERLLFGRGDC